jgi:hypothetical protein
VVGALKSANQNIPQIAPIIVDLTMRKLGKHEPVRVAGSLVAHLLCIGNATRNEAENYGEKCCFIGEFKHLGDDGTQRAE